MKTLPKGHLSCLSPAFKYTPANSTNIAVTFARVRRCFTVHRIVAANLPALRERRA